VYFKIVFVNPGKKKTLSMPIGVGGSLSQQSVAITIHPEYTHSTEPDRIAIDQCPTCSHDMQGHFILNGFSGLSADRSQALEQVSPCAQTLVEL
jgi:hypothetical protein